MALFSWNFGKMYFRSPKDLEFTVLTNREQPENPNSILYIAPFLLELKVFSLGLRIHGRSGGKLHTHSPFLEDNSTSAVTGAMQKTQRNQVFMWKRTYKTLRKKG